MTHHPRSHLAVSMTTGGLCPWSLAMPFFFFFSLCLFTHQVTALSSMDFPDKQDELQNLGGSVQNETMGPLAKND